MSTVLYHFFSLPVNMRWKILGWRGYIIQDSPICDEAARSRNRNPSRSSHKNIQRYLAGIDFTLRRPRRNCSSGDMGDIFNTLESDDTIWRTSWCSRWSVSERQKETRYWRTNGFGRDTIYTPQITSSGSIESLVKPNKIAQDISCRSASRLWTTSRFVDSTSRIFVEPSSSDCHECEICTLTNTNNVDLDTASHVLVIPCIVFLHTLSIHIF